MDSRYGNQIYYHSTPTNGYPYHPSSSNYYQGSSQKYGSSRTSIPSSNYQQPQYGYINPSSSRHGHITTTTQKPFNNNTISSTHYSSSNIPELNNQKLTPQEIRNYQKTYSEQKKPKNYQSDPYYYRNYYSDQKPHKSPQYQSNSQYLSQNINPQQLEFGSTFTEQEEAFRQLELSKKDKHQLSGITNLGNTCFMNSIFQCLFHTSQFFDFLLYEQDLNDKIIKQFNQGLAVQFQLLFNVCYHGISDKQDIKSLFQVMNKNENLKQFTNYDQQDSQEFLRTFLDELHSELNKSKKRRVYKAIQQDIHEKDELEKKGEEFEQQNQERENSLIRQQFQGIGVNKIKCKECKYKIFKFENFLDISLAVPEQLVEDKIHIKELFKDYFKKEDIDKQCDKCKSKDVYYQQSVWKPPKYLVMHIKRVNLRGKTFQKIQFDEKFILDDYLNGTKKKYQYQLYSMVSHFGGEQQNIGHYKASVKNPKTEKWYCYSDQVIDKFQLAPQPESSNIYILFYQLIEK